MPIDPVCSISNMMKSVEYLWWNNVALPNNELLVSKNDYDARIDEIKAANCAILWDLSETVRTWHWSAQLSIGVTTYQDFGNQKLYNLTDVIKYVLDCSLYIPIFDYTQTVPTDNQVNTLVVIGPVKWLPIIKEPNNFRTSMFLAHVKYAQAGYL